MDQIFDQSQAVSSPPPADGEVLAKTLRGRNFSEDEINEFKGQMTDVLRHRNFSDQDIKNFWGVKDPDTTDIQNHVKNNIAALAQQPAADGSKPKREPIDVSPQPIQTKDWLDAVAAGWSHGFLGYAVTGRESPPIEMAPDSGTFQTAVSGLSQVASDSPMIGAGMAIGERLGGKMGAYFGMGFLPEAMRKFVLDKYRDGEFQGPQDAAQHIASATFAGLKAGAATMAMGAAGENLRAINALGGGGALQKALTAVPSQLAAEAAAQTTVAAGLEGHLPRKEDFVNGAISMFGLHAVGYGMGKAGFISDKLQNIWANTGAKPADVLEAASKDPVLKTELASGNEDLPKEAVPAKNAVNEEAALPEQKENPSQPKDTVSDAKEHLLSRIGEPVEPEDKSLAGKARAAFDEVYRNRLDSTVALKDAINEYKDQPLDSKNAHVIARLLPSIDPKTREFLQVGTRDGLFGKFNGEPAQKIYNEYKEDTSDKDLSNFKAYGLAQRATELAGRGKDQDIDIEKAKAFVAAHPEIEPYFQRKVEYNDRLVDYYQSSGMISKDMADSWKTMNSKYAFSFGKILEPDSITGKFPSSSRQIKEIGSSDLQIEDPVLQDLKHTRQIIQLAHENYAKTRFADQMLNEENPNIRISENQKGAPSDSQIDVYRDGQRTLYDVPADVAESIKGMSGNRPALELYLNAMGPWAKMERVLTVDNPFFAPLHMVRQNQVAAGLSKTGFAPFLTSLKYLPQFLWGKATSSGAYQDALSDGTFQESVLPMQSWVDGQVESIEKKLPFMSRAYNQIKTVGELSHYLITLHDNLIRFSEQQKVLQKTGDRAAAAFAGREVLPDIQKMGLLNSALLQFTPFSRVGLLGKARMAQELGEDGAAYFRKNLTWVTIPAVLTYLAHNQSLFGGKDDDAYKDLPWWEKTAYFNWHMSDWRPANSDAEYNSVKSDYPSNTRVMPDGTKQINDGEFYRVPKAFTTGIGFGSALESGLESWRRDKPEIFGQFVKNVLGSMGEDLLPPPIKTLLEVSQNYNSFTNQPIMRQSMLDKVPALRYDRYTSDTAKKIAGFFQSLPVIGKNETLTSPAMIDYIIHSFGSGSYFMTSAMDKVIQEQSGHDDRLVPRTWAETPGARQFLFQTPNLRAQSVMDFDDNYREASQFYNSIKAAGRMDPNGDLGLFQKVEEYNQNMPKLGQWHKQATFLQSYISGLDLIKTKDEDPVNGLTPIEKRQLYDSSVHQLLSIAIHANQIIDDMKKTGK